MGRQRKKIPLRIKEKNLNPTPAGIDFKDIFDVREKKGLTYRVYLNVSQQEKDLIKQKKGFQSMGLKKELFYLKNVSNFPKLCRELGIVFAEMCIEDKIILSDALRLNNSIDRFLCFLKETKINIKTFRELNPDLMIKYRNHLRNDSQTSPNNKGVLHRNFIRLIKFAKRRDGINFTPDNFVLPIYRTERTTPIPILSDFIIYQIICFAVNDCETIMKRYEYFQGVNGQGKPVEPRKKTSWTIENFAWLYVHVFKCAQPPFKLENEILQYKTTVKKYIGGNLVKLIKSKSVEEWKELSTKGKDPRYIKQKARSIEDIIATWKNSLSFIYNGNRLLKNKNISKYFEILAKQNKNKLKDFIPVNENKPEDFIPNLWGQTYIHAFLQHEVPTIDTLLPFFLVFSLFTGRNHEVIKSWKRTTKQGFRVQDINYNSDIIDKNSIVMMGVKARGKKGDIEEDPITIDINGMLYRYLCFIIKYTKPLANFIESPSADDLWLAIAKNNYTPYSKPFDGNLHMAMTKFCDRHKIIDDESSRLKVVDTRAFRKVYITQEMLTHLYKHKNFASLAEKLKTSLKHKTFDTTVSHYLANDKTNQTIDTAIITLQEHLIDQSLDKANLMDNSPYDEPRIGKPTALSRGCNMDVNCDDYDLCLGCPSSRAYEEHLPRICARIKQYESRKKEMLDEEWDNEYLSKYQRANSVLTRWSNQNKVSEAWKLAESGTIPMPPLN